MKTSEMSGVALDWAVCIAEGESLAANNLEYPDHATFYPRVSPSTDWALAGPIIEREGIQIMPLHTDGKPVWRTWVDIDNSFDGPTPLIAAMRCFVASKLGDTVEIPEEFKC